jgi:hypothetical protein
MKGPTFSSPISSSPVSRGTHPASPVNPFQVPNPLPKGEGIWLDEGELPPSMD